MVEKHSIRLVMAERFALLGILPQQGDIITYKLLRKFREALSPSEQEVQEYSFNREWRCSTLSFDEKGRRFQCEVSHFSGEMPKCHIHSVFMAPTGMINWEPKMSGIEKEIICGNTIKTLVEETLKKLSDDKLITNDTLVSLYDRFFPPEEITIPLGIMKSME